MRQLMITLVTPSGMELDNTQLPDDMATEEIISELKEQLGLKDVSSSGDPIRYFLVLESRDLTMAPGQSLRDAGLENGDKLRLMASHSVEETKTIVAETSPGAATIRVRLAILDLNQIEETSLPADKAVSALIADLISQYKPNGKAGYGNSRDYRMQSKALGLFLSPSQTLGEAGVPQGDTLSLHKFDTAGATRC